MAETVHELFGLNYANMLVLPRSLLQSMPDEWQEKFAALMEEYNSHWADLPDGFKPPGYRVQPTDRTGCLVSWARFKLPHYNRGRTRVDPDGTVRNGGYQ